MQAVRIYAEPEEIDDRLSRFGLARADFFPVIEQVVAARADTISVDAASAAGLQAYLAGVRHSRLMLLTKGYRSDSTGNVESAVHPETGVKIVYQSVDLACSKLRGPLALNGKGPAADRMVENAQGVLFRLEDLPQVIPEGVGDNKSVWFLCVSVNDDDVAAEISLPATIRNKNFDGFIERIFLVQPGEWEIREVDQPPADLDEYDFVITRKE